MVMCDFVEIFNDDSWARYYIFIYSILIYCTLLIVVFMQSYGIAKFCVLLGLHFAFLIYVVIKKPFRSKFSNFKSISIQIILLVLLSCNLAIVANPSYTYGLELGIMLALCFILVGNVAMYVIQVFFAYYE